MARLLTGYGDRAAVMILPPPEDAGPDGLSRAERAELRRALALLRGGNRLARLAGAMARGVSAAAAPMLRMGLHAAGGNAALLQPTIEAVLTRAFDVAILRTGDQEGVASGRLAPKLTPLRARLMAALSGAVGGAAGLPGFLPDAAFTTLLILRVIARAAQAQGADLADEDTRRACLEVFMFGGAGGRAATDPDAKGGESDSYWTARLLVQGAPLVRVAAQAAARFGVVLSQKLVLQAVPVAGAASGALVNAAFLDHYRALAEGHFIIRRLERIHGADTVRAAAAMSGRPA